jgi:hypothetical protein
MAPAPTTSEKFAQTFRMPMDLVYFLKAEAKERGVDLTAHVVRYLEGVRTWFGLPVAVTALLEADREALGLQRYEYLLHLLYQRGLELRDKPPGFDGPGGREPKKRPR